MLSCSTNPFLIKIFFQYKLVTKFLFNCVVWTLLSILKIQNNLYNVNNSKIIKLKFEGTTSSSVRKFTITRKPIPNKFYIKEYLFLKF